MLPYRLDYIFNPFRLLPISIHLDVRSFDLVVEPSFLLECLAADCPIRSSQQLEQFAILITEHRSHFDPIRSIQH